MSLGARRPRWQQSQCVGAIVGGAAVLVVAHSAGWLHAGTAKTVVVREAAPSTGDAASPVVAARPLVGNGFQPAQIYRTPLAGRGHGHLLLREPGRQRRPGLGFVASADGIVLTSAHVITTAGQGQTGKTAPAQRIFVEFADGDRVQARIVGYDLYDDVGVLKVDPAAHAVAPIPLGDSNRVVVGQPVAAIGSPFGNVDSLSVGVVSAIRRSIPSLTSRYNLVDAIQTDAPINHGNSGGPLFDARGRVIGINAQIRSSGTGSGFEGVGFAVPIDSAKRSLQQLQATGKVEYAYVGITTENLTPSIARPLATRRGRAR